MRRIGRLTASIFLILAILVGYFYFFQWNKDHPDYEGMKADFILPAEKLYKEFTTNPEKADAVYGDKIVQISGRANAIDMTDTTITLVYVFNEGMFGDEGIRCVFGVESTDEVQAISDDEAYSIKGKCSGFNEVDVILEKCVIIK